ncbi:MAG TPA: hypothetical protein VK541_20345 [Pedobacter sp.]|uniref:hypothetical protein n=1 Tax=Pedobacter sp. TaxID=1411316 RepID=UPI002CD4301F|nr:hypothetical protein [Pedobacter sp.]HMI04850.1 hypothetical protein [Pedobacter sp.]
MNRLFFLIALFTGLQCTYAQRAIEDKAMIYQQERMVYKQWDRGKFEPGSGFLGLNPYYWLTWGLHPNYPDTDRRPLVAWGPQSQRLGMVGTMNGVSNGYKLEADTLRNTSLLEIANVSGAVSAADPLWILYYNKELKPVMEHSPASMLNPLAPAVRAKVLSEGLYGWYKHELEVLKERIDGARTADMDRGSRILAYHRMLQEYRVLSATWATRTANGMKSINLTGERDKVKQGQVPIQNWNPDSDVEIANQVIQSRKY